MPFLPHLLAQSNTGRCSALQVRGAFERHRPADILVGRLDLGFREAEAREEVEAGRVHSTPRCSFRTLGAEILAERPAVEDELDLEGAGEASLDVHELLVGEALRLSDWG